MSTRSDGCARLWALGISQTEVARSCGVSKVTAHQWFSGEKKPGRLNKQKLLSLYDISPGSWEVEHSTPAATPKEAADAVAAGGAFAMAHELSTLIRKQMDEIRAELEEPADERRTSSAELAKSMGSLAAVIGQVAKLTGAYDLGRRLTRLPIWRQIEVDFGNVIRDCPDCQEKAAAWFERLDKRARGEEG